MMACNKSRPQKRIVEIGNGFAPIEVNYWGNKIYSKCSSYGQEVPGVNWHEFRVVHRNQLKYAADSKKLILDGLFNAIDSEELYPVAYQSGPFADTFLARNCKSALDKLFAKGLSITLSTSAELQVLVILNVSKPNTAHINPPVEIARAVDSLMENLEQQDGVTGLLNLSNFGSHPRFKQVVVSLANVNTLRQVCQNVQHNNNRFHMVNGFIFANNGISNLLPLNLFGDTDYDLLDLSNNQIKSHRRLCSDLERFRAKELRLANNPIIKSPRYPKCMEPLAKNFKLIDGVAIDKLNDTYTPLNYEIDLECDGVRIDWSNKHELAAFQDSKDWHACKIPDPSHALTKDMLFDYFFITVNHSLSEFYPCYYKFENGEHSFIVRNCYDQIFHLVQICNLELKIPQLVTGEKEVNLERKLPYYLRMNVSQFKPSSHVDPYDRIGKCLDACFNVQDRVLKLDMFRCTPGLENVVVSLSSPPIVTKILTMASRKFMNHCTELKLSKNKIMRLDCLKTLRLMVHLKSLDLSHNWIHDLEAIRPLEVLHLKSLTLHGNPLCQKYPMPSEYVAAVREVFVGLNILDNVELSDKVMPVTQKNFLCNVGAYELCETFLKKFLTEYESHATRESLRKYYTDKSLFTLTCEIKRKNFFQRTRPYATHSSNIKRLADLSRASIAYHVGGDDIISLFMQLPPVRFDFVSLQTDVMHWDGKSAIIYVNGLMEDISPIAEKSEIPFFLGFSRQFVLKVDATGLGIGKKASRWKITNEHIDILVPSPNQMRSAFKMPQAKADPPQTVGTQEVIKTELQKSLLFGEITGLRQPWCTKILEMESYDIKNAFKRFLDEEEKNQIPIEAYT
ncbi:LOW QUALITY PROTEIN: nuclear RNA export factor 2-like [Drosophila tropicalis]|uniref:LOW QUALITY PROTEIN: nuclear RNA export factor 2-like n=1 Tax=Drosophila tropicalis TaxID=46794 RepID=UPI0035AC1FA8